MHKWGSVSSVSVEVGSENGLQPAQYSCRDRLLCQVITRPGALLTRAHKSTGIHKVLS